MYMEDPKNREYLISLECVGGGGDVLPNMLILSGKQHLEKWFEENDLDDNVAFAVSDSGYSNDEISLEWLEHFDKHTRKKRKGAWCMLIMDGAESHTHSEFVRVCYSKNIVPFRLPPHRTHLLQPLDVVCFQPLKHYHAEAIDAAVRSRDAEFSKVEFLARITTIRKQAFKKNTILSSFRKTGLIPDDPSVVFNKLQEVGRDFRATPEPLSLSNPSTPERLPKDFFFTTPITLKQLKLHAEALTNSDYSPSTRKVIQEKYVKGSLAKAGSGELAEDELKGVRKTEMERAARRKSTNRVVQKGGDKILQVGSRMRCW